MERERGIARRAPQVDEKGRQAKELRTRHAVRARVHRLCTGEVVGAAVVGVHGSRGVGLRPLPFGHLRHGIGAEVEGARTLCGHGRRQQLQEPLDAARPSSLAHRSGRRDGEADGVDEDEARAMHEGRIRTECTRR